MSAAVPEELAELDDIPVAWEGLPGGQSQFLSCPVFEAMAEGNRGGGKTETLLADYLQDVGQGWGSAWRGVLFRRKMKDLDDVVAKSKRLIHRIFPRAQFLQSKADYRWRFPWGEELAFRIGEAEEDYWAYHGHELPWLGFEELTAWPNLTFYEMMHSCCRSSVPGIPKKVRSTTNPWGPGHAQVKDRFKIEPGRAGRIIREPAKRWEFDEATGDILEVEGTVSRTYVHIDLRDNVHLLRADPSYVANLSNIKNPELRRAWLDGDWDIVVGTFLQGIWDPAVHVVEPFPIPLHWRRWRAGDWGTRKPYSIAWYAQSPDGVIYRYRELYGWGGKPDTGTRESASQVAAKMKAIEAPERKRGVIFARNPMDPGCFDNTGAELSAGDVFRRDGISWMKAEKGPGSRQRGADLLTEHLKAGTFKVFRSCRHWLRTVPVLEYDEANWEDVDTDMEDHAYDETRYSLVSRHRPTDRKHREVAKKEQTFDQLAPDPDPNAAPGARRAAPRA